MKRSPVLFVPVALVVALTSCTAESDERDAAAGTSRTPAATSADAGGSGTPVAPAAAGVVSTVPELEAALAAAAPGTVIDLAPGTYVRDGGDRWTAAADGTAELPITLRGDTDVVLASDGITGDYGLHVTGDHWRIEGLSVREATKGIVLDGSVGTILSRVDVGPVGEEGVHFRACSSDSALLESTVHDTGKKKPRFGEGVYVGSANSNWDKYACADGGGRAEVDDTERVRIEGNTFRDIAAEGADLKEGVDSGILRANTFVNAGYSGENSADSAIDVKANGWAVADNIVREPSGAALDGIQVHSVFEGYGTGNRFRGNVIEGRWPGSGFGLFPAEGNVVNCTNSAPDAAEGLVSENGHRIDCDP